MKTKNKVKAGIICCCCCCILWSFTCNGQTEGANIPLGAMPMQYNPSFAGEAGTPRISSSVSYKRNTSLTSGPGSGDYTRTMEVFSAYDQFIPALGTGIGITTGYSGTNDIILEGKSFLYSVAIAPKFSIKGKYTLSPSLDFGHSTGKIDFTDPSPFFSPEEESEVAFDNFSSKAGLLFNTNKYYVGYSVILFNSRNQRRDRENSGSFEYFEGFKSYLQLGYSFRRSSESKFSFTPQVAFSIMEKTPFQDDSFTWESINLNFKYNQYIAGINNMGFHLGLQNEKIRLMLSGALSSQGYQSNLSFRYIFAKTDKPGGRSGF